MRWLSRARARFTSRVGGESGATIIFIAIALLALLAMTAFVIDLGRVWQERRELQVGATASALAVAEDCARDLCVPGYSELAIAETYADANAIDGAAGVDWVALDLVGQTVHVATSTENAVGGNTLDMMFARIVGFDAITVGADAKVAWGIPIDLTTIPLIISNCEWSKTDPGWPAGNGNLLPLWPDLTGAQWVTLTFHDATGTEDCNAQPGLDEDADGKLPGGFGWLDANSACASVLSEGGWADADPGASPSNGCSASEMEDLLLGDPVFIPYFDDVDGISGMGTKGEYLIAGYGAFSVIGYNFGGPYKEYRTPLTSLPCSGSTRCVAGYFVQHVVHGGGPGDLGGTDRGATVIKLIG